MRLSRLLVKDYRNYHTAELSFEKGMNLLYGNNGEGKTNLLEAVFLFAAGKSHRTGRDTELIREGAPFASLHLDFEAEGRAQSMDIVIASDKRKRLKVNGISLLKMGELMGHLNAVLFSPEDLSLIKGGPSGRRRFMDIALCQAVPGYYFHLQQFLKVLEQRNALLKRMSPNEKEGLLIWDEQLSEHGAVLWETREKFVKALSPLASHYYGRIGKEEFSVTYETLFPLEGKNREEIKEEYQKVLLKTHDKDLEYRMTTTGPHRDELLWCIGGRPARTFASQGQQRTAALSLRLAESEWMGKVTGEAPILLLDDILSELDADRRKKLVEDLDDKQVMLTCTDLPDFTEKSASAGIFYIEGGSAQKRRNRDVFTSGTGCDGG